MALTLLLALPGCSAKLRGITAVTSDVEQDLVSLSGELSGLLEKQQKEDETLFDLVRAVFWQTTIKDTIEKFRVTANAFN